MSQSDQHDLSRVQKPGLPRKEGDLPFVFGILAYLSGTLQPEVPLSQREFASIDRDNFNEVLKSIHPVLSLSVPNRIDVRP